MKTKHTSHSVSKFCSPGVSAELIRHMELQDLLLVQGVQGNQRTVETIIVQETTLSLKTPSASHVSEG